MNITLLLRLLSAHLLADFFLQSDKLCKAKNESGKKGSHRPTDTCIHPCFECLYPFGRLEELDYSIGYLCQPPHYRCLKEQTARERHRRLSVRPIGSRPCHRTIVVVDVCR